MKQPSVGAYELMKAWLYRAHPARCGAVPGSCSRCWQLWLAGHTPSRREPERPQAWRCGWAPSAPPPTLYPQSPGSCRAAVWRETDTEGNVFKLSCCWQQWMIIIIINWSCSSIGSISSPLPQGMGQTAENNFTSFRIVTLRELLVSINKHWVAILPKSSRNQFVSLRIPILWTLTEAGSDCSDS